MAIERNGDLFLMRAGDMSYALDLNGGRPVNLHWGGRVDRAADLPAPALRQKRRHTPAQQSALAFQEYPVFYGEFFNECAFKARGPDGAGLDEFVVADARVLPAGDYDDLEIELREKHCPFTLTLAYRVWKERALIERRSVFHNGSAAPLALERFASAAWTLPETAAAWRLTHLYGRWAKEGMINRVRLGHGKVVIESRTGLSGPHAAPFFALDGGDATEEAGEVFFGTLAWSGNWKIAVERDPRENTVVTGGINDFDCPLVLAPGETFSTPVFYAGWTRDGFGGMSRILHRHQLEHVLPPANAARPMPFLFNSWGSLGTDVNEERILAAARAANRIGAELFVIDDGWQSALGDWWPDPKKFPGGLKPVIEKVRDLGMDFGLWVEIESFELDSELYKRHPEWTMRQPGRRPFVKRRDDVDRNSVMLNLARREAADYLHETLHRLVAESGIRYLKLDMNTFVGSPGWGDAPPPENGRLWIDYVHNLWGIFERLGREFPDLLMENCAAGGGRVDWGMARFFGRINRSDNQDALDILTLHEGFSQFNHPRLAGGACHISDSMFHVNERRTPLRFQAYCGMLGSLACGKNLPRCGDDEIAAIRAYGELYKQLRPVLHFGDFYRLADLERGPYAAFAYVARDRSEAVVFVLGASQRFGDTPPPLRVPGLRPDAVYSIVHHGAPEGEAPPPPLSGRGLATLGLRFQLLGDYDARLLHLRAR